jgi:hypothetical protein
VLVEATRRGWRSILGTSDASVSIARRMGIVEPLTFNPAESVITMLDRVDGETVVLAGVSEGDGAEKHLIAAARAAGIPTCLVLDNWGWYEQRLTGTMGTSVLPDVIAVMNDEARRAITADGFYDGRIIVTGHPGLDEFQHAALTNGEEIMAAARGELGIPQNGEMVAFVSQPLAQQFGTRLGYDQYDAIAMLDSALPDDCGYVVAAHPREDPAALSACCPGRAIVLRDYDPLTLYIAADIVASCFSASLTEAVLVGRPAISIQPHGRSRDHLWTNICGATKPAYTANDLLDALRDARETGRSRAELDRRRDLLGIPTGGTARVMTLVEELASA